MIAPVSLCLGLLSALGFLGLMAVPIGFVGTIVSLICILRLRKTHGEYGGMWLAVCGLCAVVCLFHDERRSLGLRLYRPKCRKVVAALTS